PMPKVLAGITISLDGYITGPNDGPGAGLGEGGERLHYWVFGGPWNYDGERGSPSPVDQRYLDEVFSSGGAWIVGRTMHDVVNGWGDDPRLRRPRLCRHPPPPRDGRQGRHELRVRDGRHRRRARARPGGRRRQERDRHGRRRTAQAVPRRGALGRAHPDDRAGPARSGQAPLRRTQPHRHRLGAHRGDRITVRDPPPFATS